MQNLYEITGYDKCYLWCGKADGPLKGVITTKRYPSSMTMDDIIGEYLIDSDQADDSYVGLENLLPPGDGWWEIVNNSGDGDNVLKLSWYDSGTYDTFYFTEVLTDDNYCLSFDAFKTIWYERSGYNQSFHPTNFGADMFSDIGLWTQLDSYNRMLWNDEYGSNYIYYSDMVYPISNITGGSDDIYLYKRDNLSKNQLIRYKDIPNFALFNLKIEGLILHPTFYPTENNIRLQYVMPNGNGYYDIISASEEIDTDHEIVDTYDNIYYTDLDYSSDKNKPESMRLSLIGNFYRRFSEDNVMNTPINVTFANGYTYPFVVVSEMFDTEETVGSYRVILNGEWRSSTSKPNPNSSLYEGVYESYSNYHSPNSEAIMYIYVKGYSTFTIYIRSYAESSWDYVMVSQLDELIDGSTSTGVNVKAHTSGNQQSGTAIGNYSKVVYDIPNDGYEHRIMIVYRKDSGVDTGDDRGYLLIQKSNPNVSSSNDNIINTINARCDNTEKFSLSQIGTVTAIDYSNLCFSYSESSGPSTPSERYGTIRLSDYWIGLGASTAYKIYLNDYSIAPDSNFTCTFLSPKGEVIGSSTGKYYSSSHTMDVAYTDRQVGEDFYVRVLFYRYGDPLYICFKVRASEYGFTNICYTIGDCTVWLQNTHDQRIDITNNTSATTSIYPVMGDFTGGKVIDGYLYDTFAHGCFNSNSTSYYTIRYESEAFPGYSTDGEIYNGDIVSLISPECRDISDLWDYMQGDPRIWVSGHN